MAPLARYSIVAALLVATAAASYAIGLRVGGAQSKGAVAAVLASVQVDLGLSRVLRLRDLESDLARNCLSEALAKVRADSDTQMLVLSSLYKEYKGTWVVGGIAKRDPAMPAQLEQFRQTRESWVEPKCTK